MNAESTEHLMLRYVCGMSITHTEHYRDYVKMLKKECDAGNVKTMNEAVKFLSNLLVS